VRAKLWGVRGSIPVPGPDAAGYGGNTSCVAVSTGDGCELILDAGSGIRALGDQLVGNCRHVHILLTHLHLDHIQGLLFYSPLFETRTRVTIWGPAAPGVSLKNRIGRYLSAPLTPIDVRELPCEVDFRNCPVTEWQIGSARIRAEAVNHRGPTLGFRIEDAGASLCYLPDHEPALLAPIDDLETEWISGFSLARGCDLLLHDCQYTDEEYPSHFGWGHSSISDAVRFAHRCEASRVLLFHHDPQHSDDQLDAMLEEAAERWEQAGGAPDAIVMARDGAELALEAQAA